MAVSPPFLQIEAPVANRSVGGRLSAEAPAPLCTLTVAPGARTNPLGKAKLWPPAALRSVQPVIP